MLFGACKGGNTGNSFIPRAATEKIYKHIELTAST